MLDETNKDYSETYRYGLFMNPNVEIDEKKINVVKETY